MDYAPPTPPIPEPADSGDDGYGATSFDIASIDTANLPPYDGHSGVLTPAYDMPTIAMLAPPRMAAITDQRTRRISQHEQLALELAARLEDLQSLLSHHAVEAGELSREQYDLVALMKPTLEQITRIRQLDNALHAKMGLLQTLRLHWQYTARDLQTHMEAAHSLRASQGKQGQV